MQQFSVLFLIGSKAINFGVKLLGVVYIVVNFLF